MTIAEIISKHAGGPIYPPGDVIKLIQYCCRYSTEQMWSRVGPDNDSKTGVPRLMHFYFGAGGEDSSIQAAFWDSLDEKTKYQMYMAFTKEIPEIGPHPDFPRIPELVAEEWENR